jgi:UDP-N-acetylmuramoyl-L-alanyl-D-glutamate--2,6-diaminopimelate ligase
MLLNEIAQLPGVLSSTITGPAKILGIAYDSRRVQPGFLFVAIRGEKTDGNRYVEQALGSGAIAVASEHPNPYRAGIAAFRVHEARAFLALVSRAFHNDPAARLKLAGITGTNGKTTTSFLLFSIFRSAGIQPCLVGTLGMKIGDKPFPSAHTTPESSDLTEFLGRALQAGCTHGAAEVSSHALALKRVFGTKFRIGIWTNLAPEHLDFHHDMDSYYQAKRVLFLPVGGNDLESAVINADDPFGKRLRSEISIPTLTFGFEPEADIRVLDWNARIDGTRLRLATPAGELEIGVRLSGRPHVYNAMAATGAALSMGLGLETIRQGIENLEGVPGRMQLVRAGQTFTVIVDYAHTPDALETLLENIRQLPHGRLITVFGCGGDRDRKKRPAMGRIAGRLSDVVIATSDNPRTENPRTILAEIEPGLRESASPYQLQPDRRQAIRAALSMARADDAVVIAGKGHESYQVIGTDAYPFDDCTVARELILQLLGEGAQNDRELHE